MADRIETEQQRAWIDLRKLRESRGWVQEEAAQKLGVARTHLSSVETGHRGVSLRMMRKIIQVFGVKYEDFYSSSGD